MTTPAATRTAPAKPAVLVEGVTRKYAEARALDGISLRIEEGEFVSIIGTSGSGKTTLLNVVGALDRGYEGVVEVEGRNLATLSDRELSAFRNETIGFVFQHFHLLGHLSCAENVTVPSFFARRHRTVDAAETLGRVGLADKLDAMPSALSGGQKQRVAIARALALGPRLILCDEPTGNLDRRTGEQILELFSVLNREEGITLVIVTHEEHISRAADRVIRLEDGQVVA